MIFANIANMDNNMKSEYNGKSSDMEHIDDISSSSGIPMDNRTIQLISISFPDFPWVFSISLIPFRLRFRWPELEFQALLHIFHHGNGVCFFFLIDPKKWTKLYHISEIIIYVPSGKLT